MAWETRKGKLYYYAKKRVNGKVVSVYLGRGSDAHKWEGTVERSRAERAACSVPTEEQTQWQKVEQLQSQLHLDVAQVLNSAGLHRPNRKRWMSKRLSTS